MSVYAVIDTNVIISSLLTHNQKSPTRIVLDMVREGRIVPMVNSDITEEYREVLSRSKFHFSSCDVSEIMGVFSDRGEIFVPDSLRGEFVDLNDVIFYETYLLKDGAYLVTGNLKHFPVEPRIIPPVDMVGILHLSEGSTGYILSEATCPYISHHRQAKLQRAWEAVERMRASALANGISDMTMEEIDEEIRQYREERRANIRPA